MERTFVRQLGVSVVLTCYNLERYVGDALLSVSEQDFSGPIDIVVVDDSSTDRSSQVIERFPQARYFRSTKNQGVLLSTIMGIEAAKYDLVFLLDGDDKWKPTKISHCVTKFVANQRLGFITHDLFYADADAAPLARRTHVEEVLGSKSINASAEVRRGILSAGDYVWLGSAMGIRRGLIRFDEFAHFARGLPDPRNTYQDWPLAYWIACQQDVDLDYVPEKLFFYRLHDQNYSGTVATIDQAVRNLGRTLNTHRAMAEIGRLLAAPVTSQRFINQRVIVDEYLLDLVSGQRMASIFGLVRCLPSFIRRRLLMKELLRFLGIHLLGQRRFVTLTNKRKVLRNLPVT